MDDRTILKVTDLRDLPLVEVEWSDASSTHGWFEPLEARKEADPVGCLTVGRLIRNDRKVVAVVQTVAEHGKVSEVWAIPRGWVKRVRRLR